MTKRVVIIGGGVAGMVAASQLDELGHEVTLVERETCIGGKLLAWDRLFPTRRHVGELLNTLNNQLSNRVKVYTGTELKEFEHTPDHYIAKLENGLTIVCDALIVATGFKLFDAQRKEEYGYGIYDNVITQADLENAFRNKQTILTANGNVPKRVAFVHCVGSRDQKVGNEYCSKVCCVTGVKQAIELKEVLPSAEIFCLYMDLRMYGRYFEDLYREAQEKHRVQFIRGRLSEACENQDGSIQVKTEDTLTGRPLRMDVDLLVLLAGMVPSVGAKKLAEILKLKTGKDGFYVPVDEHIAANTTSTPGVFVCGAATGPKTIEETIADARAAALKTATYLVQKHQMAMAN